MDLKNSNTPDSTGEPATASSCAVTRPPAGLISNPRSFYNRRRPEPVLQSILKDYPEVHKYPARDRADIRTAVEALHAIDARLVIANGGDGTVQGVISEVWHKWQGKNMPLLAVMPGGRTNVISQDLNVKMRPRNILRNILQNYCSGDADKRIHRALLDIRIDNKVTELGFLISAAGLAGGIEQCWDFRYRYRKFGLYGGFGTAAWVIRRLLGTPAGKPILEPRKAKVIIDGERIPGDQQQLVMITTNQQFPVLIHPFWSQSQDSQSEIKITAVKADAKGLWWRSLPLALGWGKMLSESAGFYSRSAKHIQMQLEQSFHLDGESWTLEHPQTVDIRPGPTLEFITA